MLDRVASWFLGEPTRIDLMAILKIVTGAGLALSIALACVVAVPTATLAAYWSYQDWSFHRRTPIAAGTADDFAARIAASFAVGSPAKPMQDELSRQGFVILPRHGNTEHVLDIEHASFPCRSTWSVSWTADSSGAIGTIDGRKTRVCL